MTDAPREDELTVEADDVTDVVSETYETDSGVVAPDVVPETYETDSGVVADIDDVEVDVVPSGEGAIVSSQADPEAYGVEVDDDVEIPDLPENGA